MAAARWMASSRPRGLPVAVWHRRQECELSRSRVALLDQVGHPQRTVGEPERAFGGIFGVLAAVASEVHPGVAG